MALASGTRLGPYEIIAPAGAGGMGEVYRARDTRLNREVAVKILPDHLSGNPELRERFEREARAISQLSHPHICVLHDVGKHEGADYLVMEYLEGETLGTRLMRGPLPTEQVLKYGAQMADALDKAHRHGVVHRDLKPDNVMLTKSGVKLLDFGLAKPAAGAVGTGSSRVATMTHSPLTTDGTLVGTFQYMAPEQLEGQEADARSDVFGLGCVLYEMVTGKRAFEGKSAAKVMAAILTTEPPPLATVSPMSPPALERAIRKCLAKDPEERWQSAGDLASELRWILESGSQAGVAVPGRIHAQRKLLRWGAIGLAAAVCVAGGFLLNKPPSAPLVRAAINLPPGSALAGGNQAVLSPDGQRVVMMLTDAEGRTRLWVRLLGVDAAQPLEGTEGAVDPFWSPDGQWIAFFSVDGKIRKIAAGGGPSEALADVTWTEFGGTWNADGLIVYSAGRKGLFKLPASGGTPARIPTKELTAAGYGYPEFLPDGKHVLVLDIRTPQSISAVDVDTGQAQVVRPEDTSYARYVEPGYLLFVHRGSLMAQPFSARSLRTRGSAQTIAESLTDSQESFSASRTGLLLYQPASKAQLTWVDHEGNKLSTVGEPGSLNFPRISPDGKHAVLTINDHRQGKTKLWLYDLERGTANPFTFGDGDDLYPSWSPDGKQIAFASNRGSGQEDIYLKPLGGGSGEQLLLADEGDKEPDPWSPDGRFLPFDYRGKKTKGYDIWMLPMFGDRKPFPFIQGASDEVWATFSPDGKWVAYQSDESGRAELYVMPFPGPGGRWQVSSGGSLIPWWPPGKELFYLNANFKLMAVEFDIQGTNFIVGKSHPLFGGRSRASVLGGDIARDGKRWLLILPVEEPNVSPLILTINWTAALKH